MDLFSGHFGSFPHFLDNLKLEISMRPVCLLMIFLTTLPHNLIKDKLIDLIEKKKNLQHRWLSLHVTAETQFYFGKT